MSVSITPDALALVRRSLELAKLDPARAGVRLRRAGGEVMPRFATDPEAGDEVVEEDGVRVFVARPIADSAVRIEIGVSDEHERLVVRVLEDP